MHSWSGLCSPTDGSVFQAIDSCGQTATGWGSVWVVECPLLRSSTGGYSWYSNVLKHILSLAPGKHTVSHCLVKGSFDKTNHPLNWPPHRGALDRLNYHLTSFLVRKLCRRSSFITFLSHFVAATNVLPLSEYIFSGRSFLAIRRLRVLINSSVSKV